MVGRWIDRIKGGERVGWKLATISVVAFFVCSISLGLFLQAIARWSRDHNFGRGLVASHFIAECLIAGGLWFLIWRHDRLIHLLMQCLQLIGSLSERLRNPAQTPEETKKTEDLLRRAEAFHGEVRQFLDSRKTKPLSVAASGGDGRT